MSALRAALRWLSWWRVCYAAGWLRWHAPVSRQAALRLAEEQAEAYYKVLEHKIGGLAASIQVLAGPRAEWDQNGCQPPAPGQAPVTQRDLDDAVAGLIHDARQEFGRRHVVIKDECED